MLNIRITNTNFKYESNKKNKLKEKSAMKKIDLDKLKEKTFITVEATNGLNAKFVTNKNRNIYFPKDVIPNIEVGNVYEISLDQMKTSENQSKQKKKRLRYFRRKLIDLPLDYYNKVVYDHIMEQVDKIDTVIFESPLSILIVSDRLLGVALPLATLLRKDRKISVSLVTSLDDSAEALEYSYDFVIIVGYLKDKKTYRVLRSARNDNLDVISILYAGIDESTEMQQLEYHIDYLFERDRPILEFYEFIKKLG